MTDKTVSVPQPLPDHECKYCKIVHAGCCSKECVLKLNPNYPLPSVPTESRPALQKFRTALNALYLEVEPSIANDIVDLANAALSEAAASSSLLPVGRQQILDLVERYESEIKRGIWDVSQDGMRHILRDLQLLASLPVGESTRPKIICLCGSTKFIDTWIEQYQRLSDEGNIVLTVARMPPRPHLQTEQPELKIRLDELHKRKIDLADEVFVLNVGGYIGSSTRSEIDYAEAHGKPVRYLETELGLGESREPLPIDEELKAISACPICFIFASRIASKMLQSPLPSVPAEIEKP